VLEAIGRAAQTAGNKEEIEAQIRNQKISNAMMTNTYEENLTNARKGRAQGQLTEDNKIAADALRGQAAASGVVSEAVLSAYAAAVESGDTEEMERLEETINKSMKTVIKNQEGQQAIADLTNRTFAALEQKEQEQIDAMQAVADATEEATQQMLDKMQEQIDD
jgi:hypothetical protein